MQITKYQYNTVIEGLRTQLELHRQENSEFLSRHKDDLVREEGIRSEWLKELARSQEAITKLGTVERTLALYTERLNAKESDLQTALKKLESLGYRFSLSPLMIHPRRDRSGKAKVDRKL